MTKIIGDITRSLDGFVTGPGADVEHGLGRDAEGLHAWALESEDLVDRGVLERRTAASGAVVMGRKTFDTVDGPGAWSAEMGYGADQDGRTSSFVVTSSRPARVRLAETHDVTFVLDGLAAAVQRRGRPLAKGTCSSWVAAGPWQAAWPMDSSICGASTSRPRSWARARRSSKPSAGTGSVRSAWNVTRWTHVTYDVLKEV